MRTICTSVHDFGVRWLSLLLLSCASGSPEASVKWLDQDRFARDVQPILTARCASPLCHSRPERPLSLYAPFRWRADPSRLWIDEPLTQDEVRHNYVSACLVEATADPSESPALLRKALGESVGVFHGGGVVLDENDRDYATLAAWLR